MYDDALFISLYLHWKTTEDVFGLGVICNFASGNRWSGVEILKLCQRREEHQLIANVRI